MSKEQDRSDTSHHPAHSALPLNDTQLAPLDEIVFLPQDGEKPACYWFSGAGRSLFAEATDGRWIRMDYVFPLGSRLFELRWTNGRPPRLWSVDRDQHGIEEDKGTAAPRHRELTFPCDEIQQMEMIMHKVPHTLWARLIKLALEAHFADQPFAQRSQERPPERRRTPRL